MIYRIITEFRMIEVGYDPAQNEFMAQWVVPKREYQEMTGAGECFGQIMFACGLRSPSIQNPRERFYLPERGWVKLVYRCELYGKRIRWRRRLVSRTTFIYLSCIRKQSSTPLALITSLISSLTAVAIRRNN